MKDIGREMSVPHFELWEDDRRIPDARQQATRGSLEAYLQKSR